MEYFLGDFLGDDDLIFFAVWGVLLVLLAVTICTGSLIATGLFVGLEIAFVRSLRSLLALREAA